MTKMIIPLALVCALATGCAGRTQLGGAQGLSVVAGGDLPVPSAEDSAMTQRAYVLGPRDVINMDVMGAPEMAQKEVLIDNSGRVSFPLAGSVEAVGKTAAELASAIEDRLRGAFFRNPKVNVNVVKLNSQVVTVEGEVKEPGIYPIVNRMTLLGAVASAKGATENSALEEVVVFRTVGTQKYAALYSLKSIRRGVYEDPVIYANDVVMVGESRGRRLFKDILTVLPVITTPIVLLLRG